jgi:hypothetical protein
MVMQDDSAGSRASPPHHVARARARPLLAVAVLAVSSVTLIGLDVAEVAAKVAKEE